jgi:hypothetical protein
MLDSLLYYFWLCAAFALGYFFNGLFSAARRQEELQQNDEKWADAYLKLLREIKDGKGP